MTAWTLPWAAHHLLLLTATPHQGKDYPYYALWRLLEPEVLSTLEAFDDYPPERRVAHFIRRTKEEMVHLNGKPLYPKRISDTLGYDLTQGPISEQTLYDETTDYMRHVYNRAKLLNRSAARLAMSVLQRRLGQFHVRAAPVIRAPHRETHRPDPAGAGGQADRGTDPHPPAPHGRGRRCSGHQDGRRRRHDRRPRGKRSRRRAISWPA